MEKRRKAHEVDTRCGCACLFHNALRKYGFDAFDWEALVEHDSAKFLKSIERHQIVQSGTKVPLGYNLTDGGDGIVGYTHTPTAKEKIGKASRVMHKTRPPASDETRARISRGKKGKLLGPQSGEHRGKIRDALRGRKGKPMSPEMIETLRKINTGRVITEETRAKMSKARQGKKASESHKASLRKAWEKRRLVPVSEETRRRIGVANKGRPSGMKGKKHSEETKAQMSASQKKRSPEIRRQAAVKTSESQKGRYVGRSFEERYGIEKAEQIKLSMSISQRKRYAGVS